MTVRTLHSEGGVKQDSPIPEEMLVKGADNGSHTLVPNPERQTPMVYVKPSGTLYRQGPLRNPKS